MEVTAASPPVQKKGLLRGEHFAAPGACLDDALLGHVRVTGGGARQSATLDAVGPIFGARLEAGGGSAGGRGCRERADALLAAGGDESRTVAIAYAADLFVLCSVERRWRTGESPRIISRLARLLDLSMESAALEVFLSAVRAPQLLDLPPSLALETQLRLLLALSPIAEISLWTKGPEGRALCFLEDGLTTQTRRFRVVASRAWDGAAAESGTRGTILGVPVR